ncbi:MAG: butyrate kinase [Sphaerochaetaceae bacterium]|nr:butyrate kinase [Sphaerochaetaceae bacterium]
MSDRERTDGMILAINPGSTTTKLALFDHGGQISAVSLEHTVEELAVYGSVQGQFLYRRDLVIRFLQENRVQPGMLHLAMGRGGLLHPLVGGVYRVGPSMLQDLQMATYGEHACNLGAPLADAIAKRYGCEAMIADPVVVDEMIEEARISGMPDIVRKSIFHALNHKYVARQAARRLGKPYDQCRLVVAHLGGGISVGSHLEGRVVDVNNALDGEGPFTCERSGGLPAGDLVRLALSGTYTYEHLRKRITGSGGLFAYIGSRDVKELAERAQQGDRKAEFWIGAMVYRIAKEIASHFAVLEGRVDAVVLTGGMAHNARMMDMITRRVGFMAPVIIIPGEGEMLSLAENAWAVLDGLREVMEYE